MVNQNCITLNYVETTRESGLRVLETMKTMKNKSPKRDYDDVCRFLRDFETWTGLAREVTTLYHSESRDYFKELVGVIERCLQFENYDQGLVFIGRLAGLIEVSLVTAVNHPAFDKNKS